MATLVFMRVMAECRMQPRRVGGVATERRRRTVSRSREEKRSGGSFDRTKVSCCLVRIEVAQLRFYNYGWYNAGRTRQMQSSGRMDFLPAARIPPPSLRIGRYNRVLWPANVRAAGSRLGCRG